jgi:hypothetical protein
MQLARAVLQRIAFCGVALCNAPASVLQRVAFRGVARALLGRLGARDCERWLAQLLDFEALGPDRFDDGPTSGPHLQKPFGLIRYFTLLRIWSTGVSAARTHARG